ncbi:SAM-dependent methyltransferase [Mesorhizobium sp. L-8-10]|uniref:class I SAM-dependent methyltransferase n=1 Tax=Mesorhizobium sp. L-8-10 TaxID=2744523 RepID=UPI001927D5A5|nr:class I SAM-dependent methyltransferase [Mesorhizobium sp. L-8-10]BCH33746.1 SAM-dependent methyltransferase [Mesorhizobium sp. L-8-10]
MQRIDARYPVLKALLETQLAAAPAHEKFFRRRFETMDDAQAASLDEFAGHIARLVGDELEEHVEDYVWLCSQQVNEELHFRRHGRYRLNTFEEAYRDVYSNKEYMTRYMNGLLMTQLWWSNHTRAMEFYRTSFLASNTEGYSHLEIGPGHGLFLYFAAADPRAGKVSAWDISDASIAMTAKALRRLGLAEQPALELRDLFRGPVGSFDSLVFSEVLEHMEKPAETLALVRSLLAPEGRLFLNMPINSPAPDHLFNAETPEELERFVVDAGFRIIDRAFFPATNQTLDAARRKKLTISCVFVAGRAD